MLKRSREAGSRLIPTSSEEAIVNHFVKPSSGVTGAFCSVWSPWAGAEEERLTSLVRGSRWTLSYTPDTRGGSEPGRSSSGERHSTKLPFGILFFFRLIVGKLSRCFVDLNPEFQFEMKKRRRRRLQSFYISKLNSHRLSSEALVFKIKSRKILMNTFLKCHVDTLIPALIWILLTF